MNKMEVIAASVSICMALSALCGIAIVKTEIKKYFKNSSGARIIRLFRKQAAKAAEEIHSLKKVRGILSAEKIKRELSQGTALMRNRIAACTEEKLTTDIMLEELIAESDVLRYPYARMLSLVRTEERERAVSEFSGIVRNRNAEEYARMLILLDDMDPADIYESVVSFQKNIKEERITEIKKRDEAVSDILYLPVVLDLLLVFFNFLYIAYFSQQKDILEFFM